MKRFIFLSLSSLLFLNVFASNTIVANINELELANKNAKPGDTIILKNGEWNNVTFKLDAKGLKENPIIFKAETKGKVIITGNSKLLIGGEFLEIDGFYFTKGYSGVDAVIKFSINQQKIGATSSSWSSEALYVNYDISEKFGLTLREDFFSDRKVNPLGIGNANATTLSGKIKVKKLTLIPEFRIDNGNTPLFSTKTGTASSASNFVLAAVYAF